MAWKACGAERGIVKEVKFEIEMENSGAENGNQMHIYIVYA